MAFVMSAQTVMPTVGVRARANAPRAAPTRAVAALPEMTGMSAHSLGLRRDGARSDAPARRSRPLASSAAPRRARRGRFGSSARVGALASARDAGVAARGARFRRRAR